MATFTELPYELRHGIILQAMLARFAMSKGPSRVMRLKLVSNDFATHVDEGLLTSRIFEVEFDSQNWYLTYLKRMIQRLPPLSVFHFVNSNPMTSSGRGTAIYSVAKTLIDEMGMVEKGSLESVTGTLLKLSFYQEPLHHCDREPVTDEKRDRNTSLLAAVAYFNCMPLARKLVDEGVIPWHTSSLLGSPSAAAALQGNNSVLKLFLSHDTSKSPIRRLALNPAISEGHISTFDLLLDSQLNSTWIAEWNAESTGRDKFFLDLWNALATARVPSVDMYERIMPILDTYVPGPAGVMSWQMDLCNPGPAEESRYGNCTRAQRLQTRLHRFLEEATTYRDVELAQHLIDLGADVSASERAYSTLPNATAGGSEEMVRLLLDHGADPDPSWIQIQWTSTPLQDAVARGNLEMVRMLLDAGANANRWNSMSTPPIVLALELEHVAIFQLLRERGAVLKKSDFIRKRAMGSVAVRGLESMFGLLLEEGVVPSHGTVGIAEKAGHYGLAKLMGRYVPDLRRGLVFEELGEVPWLACLTQRELTQAP